MILYSATIFTLLYVPNAVIKYCAVWFNFEEVFDKLSTNLGSDIYYTIDDIGNNIGRLKFVRKI